MFIHLELERKATIFFIPSELKHTQHNQSVAVGLGKHLILKKA